MLYKERTPKTNLRGSQSGGYLLSHNKCSTIGDAELNDPVPSLGCPRPSPLRCLPPRSLSRPRAYRRPPRASDAFFLIQRPPLPHEYIKSMVSLIRCTIVRLFYWSLSNKEFALLTCLCIFCFTCIVSLDPFLYISLTPNSLTFISFLYIIIRYIRAPPRACTHKANDFYVYVPLCRRKSKRLHNQFTYVRFFTTFALANAQQ